MRAPGTRPRPRRRDVSRLQRDEDAAHRAARSRHHRSLGGAYTVTGGPSACCGVLQFRAGDRTTPPGWAGAAAVRGLRRTAGALLVPDLQHPDGETPSPPWPRRRPERGALRRLLDRLTPHLVHRVEGASAFMNTPASRAYRGGARLLRAIPGLEFVDLEQPRVGYMCNKLAPVAAFKGDSTPELAAAKAAGVTVLVGIYHACHRELCATRRRAVRGRQLPRTGRRKHGAVAPRPVQAVEGDAGRRSRAR